MLSRLRTRDVGLLFLLALCLSWGGFNLGRSLLGPKFGLDFTQYYVASRMLLSGEVQNIYRTDTYYAARAAKYGAVTSAGETMTNAYPPFVAFFFIPFAVLRFRPALLFFSIASILALAGGVWAFSAADKGTARYDLTLAGLLISFSFFPVYYSLYMGQVNALLFLCLALAFYFSRRHRPWGAGFFLALATLVKLFPAVLLLWFAARRQFKVVAAALLSTVLLGTVSLPVCGPRLYVSYITEILPQQTDGGAFYRNQGIPGLLTRLLCDNQYVNAITNRPTLAHGLGLAGGALVLVVALWLAARCGSNGVNAELAFGLCLVAALLALPKSWEHYYLLLLFSYLALLKLVAYGHAVGRGPLLLTFLSFCIWTILLPQGSDYAQLPRSVLAQPLFSAKCLSALMLFVACSWVLLASNQEALPDRYGHWNRDKLDTEPANSVCL